MISGIKDLARAYSKKHGCSISEAEGLMKKALDVITDAIIDGGVSYMGNFTIETALRKERIGRNPLTKEEFTIPATVGLRIKCGKFLKSRLNTPDETGI